MILAAHVGSAAADVRVLVGPTPIVKGDARAAGDITVVNEHLAFALAVQSPVPYGVPRGALIDLAPVTDGVVGRDRVVFADFIPDNWSAWPNSGFYFGVPGMQAMPEGAAQSASAHRVVAYDSDWSIALHADYFDRVGDESKDLNLSHTLAAGQSRTFDGWLQVGRSGDLAPVVRTEIERRHLAAGTVQGVVVDRDAHAVEQALVMVLKGGAPYAWALAPAGHEPRHGIDGGGGFGAEARLPRPAAARPRRLRRHWGARRALGRAHRHHRRSETGGGVPWSPDVLHRARASRTRRGADRPGPL
jgi:hypothetical protein